MRRRAALGCGLALLLQGCGFHPVYAPAASGGIGAGPVQDELASVAVGIIPDRPGQLLRQALQQRLEQAAPGVAQRYELSVNYSISGEGIAIQQDNSTTRIRLIARANWVLRAQDVARTELTHGLANAVDDYNVFDQQYFAADLSNDAAQRRLANAIADQVTLQLASYFNHRLRQTASQ